MANFLKFVALSALVCFDVSAYGKNAPDIRHAKVISQNLDSSDRGTAIMPMGTGIIGVPLTRNSNIVVLQTDKARFTVSEAPTRHFIILPVNGEIAFYAEKNQIVIQDGTGKKHKFSIVHLEQLPQEK